MKVKYIGKKNKEIDLTPDKIYEVIDIHHFKNANVDWYVIVDDSGEDYSYPPQIFEVVEK